MKKTDGLIEFEKDRQAHLRLEAIDYDEKKYSYRDMQNLHDMCDRDLRNLGIIFAIMYFVSIIYAASKI